MNSLSIRSLIFLSMSSYFRSRSKSWCPSNSEEGLLVNKTPNLEFIFENRSGLDKLISFFSVFTMNDWRRNLCSLCTYFRDGVEPEMVGIDCLSRFWPVASPFYCESISNILIVGKTRVFYYLIEPSSDIISSYTLTSPI